MPNFFPWSNFHELNLDWIIKTVEEIKVKVKNIETPSIDNILTALRIMRDDGDLADILKDETAVIDVTRVGIHPGDNDNSSKFQSLLDTYPDRVFYFPRGSYIINNITVANTDLNLMLHKRAVIKSTPSQNYMFNLNNCSADIKGGSFIRHDDGTPVGSSLKSGIFKFDTCDNINIKGCNFPNNDTYSSVFVVDTENVNIDNCKFTDGTYAGISFINGNKNIDITNCIFKRFPIKEGAGYSYGIATGASTYATPISGNIENMHVDNCIFEECEWEGLDCHHGYNITFENCKMHNCGRAITCYWDSRPKFDTDVKIGNWVFKNIEIENEPDYVFSSTDEGSMMIHGNRTTGEQVENVVLENIKIINPNISTLSGAISTIYMKHLKMHNILIEARNRVYSAGNYILKFIYDHEVSIKNMTIRGLKTASNGFISVNGVTGEFENINLETVPGQTVYSGIFKVASSFANIIRACNIKGKFTRQGFYQYAHCLHTGGELVRAVNNDVPLNYAYNNTGYSAPSNSFVGSYDVTCEAASNEVVWDSENTENIYECIVPGQNITITINSTDYDFVVSDIINNTKFTVSDTVPVSGSGTLAQVVATTSKLWD